MAAEKNWHQVPINGTIQTMVPPGSQTNLYHIIVSNLPWQTSWQQLKDHVRTVCNVERVEVFNDSTSGWVAVRGRDNYDAAFRLLNGGVFNGRALIADGKNATEPKMIKELIDNPVTNGSSPRTPRTPRFTTSPSTQYSSSSPLIMSPVATGHGEWTSAATNSTYVTTSTMECAPYTVPYDYSEATARYYYDASTGSYIDQSAMIPPTTVAQLPYEACYPQRYEENEYQRNDFSMYNGIPAPGYGGEKSNPSSNDVVPTLKCKIIVKQIPSWINFNKIQSLVRQKAGSDAGEIQQIELPMTESQSANRGYALVTFWNEETAKKLIRKLDGYKLEGRDLTANYTTEGVSEHDFARSRGTKHRERRDERERKEKESSRVSVSSDKKIKSSKSDVVIAHGSSSSSKKSDSKDKHNKKH
ncbi:hypothetical protein F4779DRAFT_616885 [Xylariaceae sp. FL0662B]|nr:hypothetical protein F4779DRAFT_616885 [Xylariaceae sp. FL0662B]